MGIGLNLLTRSHDNSLQPLLQSGSTPKTLTEAILQALAARDPVLGLVDPAEVYVLREVLKNYLSDKIGPLFLQYPEIAPEFFNIIYDKAAEDEYFRNLTPTQECNFPIRLLENE